MATWSPIAGVPNPIIVDAAGTAGSGYVLKAYLPGTTTSTSIAIDSAGSSPQASLTANADGIFEVTGNEVIPYIDRKVKWGIFANAVDAAANTPFYMGPFDNVERFSSASEDIKSFDVVATVVADTNISIGDAIKTEGRRTVNDGGEGFYRVVAAGTGTADGGSYIDLTGISGQIELIFSTEVTTAQFDAVGDGVASDTTAINAAVAAIAAKGGGVVRFIASHTNAVSRILVTGDYITLDLNGSTLKQIAGSNSLPIVQLGDNVTTNTGNKVINGNFDGNAANVTGNVAFGISSLKQNDVEARDLNMIDIRRIGIQFDNGINCRAENITGSNFGVVATAIGSLIGSNNCSGVSVRNAKITSSEGVGGFFQNTSNLQIDGWEATDITLDNGLTVDNSFRVQLKNIKTNNCTNVGTEFSSTTGFSVESIEAKDNGVYGLMCNVFTGGTELPLVNGTISGVTTSGNGTDGVRVIGTQNTTFSGMTVPDNMTTTNSGGGVVIQQIKLETSTINQLNLLSGQEIDIDASCEITALVNSSGKYQLSKVSESPRTSIREVVAVSGTVDVDIPSIGTNPFNGLLVVGSYFTGSFDQNTSEIFHVAQRGTVQVTSMSKVDGTVARAMTVTVVGTNVIRITNNSGVEVVVSAMFTGVAT